ncbi:MAG: nucleoside-triphosphatase, partial [Candidatus Auribacterota bacterium]|nr:nucleoside-triphosphatase [Candidatus Auribacterota bacterium]
LAHQDIVSPFKIRRYGVSVENINNLAVPSIKPQKDCIIILDEIGKMECFSKVFKRVALEALDSPNIVIGTITFGGGEFVRQVKKRDDIEITEVTSENRNKLPGEIITTIKKARL